MKQGYGHKIYSDSTLMTWNKKELIQTIRMLEKNFIGCEEENNRKFSILMRADKLINEMANALTLYRLQEGNPNTEGILAIIEMSQKYTPQEIDRLIAMSGKWMKGSESE